MRLLDLDALAGFLPIGVGERLVEIGIELTRRIVRHVQQRRHRQREPSLPEQSAPASGTIRRIMSISIRFDDVDVIEGMRTITRGEKRLKSTKPDFVVRSSAASSVLRSLHRVDAAFRLGAAAPAARALILARSVAAGARHAPDRAEARCRRGGDAAIRRGVKIASSSSRETLANGLNFNRAPSASTTGIAARKPPWNRLRPVIQAANGFSAPASGSTLRIRQQASGSENHSSRSGSSRDSASSAGLTERTSRKPELSDQRVAIGQRLLEQPAGIEKDHGNGGIDIGHDLEQRGRLRAKRRHQRELLAADGFSAAAMTSCGEASRKRAIKLVRRRQDRSRRTERGLRRRRVHRPALSE